MTDLTGVLTSTGAPLSPGLQHNQAAKNEMRRRAQVREQAHHAAAQAAHALMVAEATVETLQGRLGAAERGQQSWSEAAGLLPPGMTPGASPESRVESLQQDLQRAEQQLGDARRAQADAAERFRVAHNDAEDFKRSVYADYRDAHEVVEVG